MRLYALVVFFVGSAVVRSEWEDNDYNGGIEEQDEEYPLFDYAEDYELEQLRQRFASEGIEFPTDAAKSFNIFSAIGEIFKTGDGRRYSILNLSYQLSCYQGRGGSMVREALWAFSRYYGYGCYCGDAKYTGKYLDETDRCCKQHNQCYNQAKRKYNLGNTCQVFTTQYTVSCCKKKRYTKCTDSGPSAARALCVCDQAMAKCVSSKLAESSYSKSNAQCRSTTTRTTTTSAGLHLTTGLVSTILKQCNSPTPPIKRYTIKYGSQGKCPAKKSHGWWIFG